MKIDQILDRMDEGIEDAYSIIEEKGGTPGQGLSELATAIGTIPEPIPDVPLYGKVGYYPWSQRRDISGEMVEIQSVDDAKLDEFLATYPPRDGMTEFMYEQDWESEDPESNYVWRYSWEEGELKIQPEDFASTTGINAIVEEGADWASVMIDEYYDVDTTADLLYAEFESEQALIDAGWPVEGGGNMDQYVLTVGEAQVYNEAIKSYVFGSEVSEFPDNFLYHTGMLDGVDATGATITRVGNNFLHNSNFNSPIDMSHCVSIGNNFLSDCQNFNQPLDVSSATIGEYFLGHCDGFNSQVTLPPDMTEVPNTFMCYCGAYNQPLALPSTLTKIGNRFLDTCLVFNQPLTIPSGVTTIGSQFLTDCKQFNQPLTIPNGVATIGIYFLNGCSSFNQPLTFPSSMNSVGAYFMGGCASFNQDLTLPSGIKLSTSRYSWNLYGLDSMVSTITIPDVYTVNNIYNDPEQFLTVSSSSVPGYTQGIKVKVPASVVSTFRNKAPNRASSPYRKVIVSAI